MFHCVASVAVLGRAGWPAPLVFVRWVVRGGMRVVVYFATLFIAARAVCRNVLRVGSGLFVVRRPRALRRCLAFKAALSCCSPAVQRVAV